MEKVVKVTSQVEIAAIRKAVDSVLFKKHGIANDVEILTKSGWDLRKGLVHIAQLNEGKVLPLIVKHGLPACYVPRASNKCRHESTEEWVLPKNCFQSLCRIVAGQQLAGPAAETVYKRLLATTENNLCPETVLQLASKDIESKLRQPSSLSGAKARCIVHLSEAFSDGSLSEDMFTNQQLGSSSSTVGEMRNKLLKVKGIGSWSCDMFFMFFLEQPNIIPFGDLGIRKGIAKFFRIKNGKAKGGSLCPKKDEIRMREQLQPYYPYQSLFCHYMWKVADTTDTDGSDKVDSKPVVTKEKIDENQVILGATSRQTRRKRRKVEE